jgi:tripartite-type tricarboxylate transporter receptor subunit TctC
MNPVRRRLVTASSLAAALPLASAWLHPYARAQGAWPNKPIRIVVGYPAGGLTDALARAYGEHLGSKLGQSVVVDNKPGAAGMLAGGEVARAAADGHTLWFTLSGTVSTNRVLFKKMPYDPDRDFVHVAGFDAGSLPMAVPAASPVRNMAQLVEQGRKQRLTFGNYATGSLPHMMAQQLGKKYGISVDAVPYKGEAPMWHDLAGGQINCALGSALALTPHLQSGKLRAIAVSTRNRSPLLPDVPTFAEQGLTEPVFTLPGWLGLFAPVGTPAAVVQRLSDLVQEGAATPRVRELSRNFGLPDKPWPAGEFEKVDRESRPQWVELARELGVSLD